MTRAARLVGHRPPWPWFLIVVAVLGGQACSSGALRGFFDLRPPEDEAGDTPTEETGEGVSGAPAEALAPPIESTLDADSALALLPRDVTGAIDWVGAQAEGVIRPRNGIGDEAGRGASSVFGYDSDFPGPKPAFDAYFPHSTHTALMECAQCHPRIFRSAPTDFRMQAMSEGKQCGACHGSVAFPMTACERCHQGADLPAGRARAQFEAPYRLSRLATGAQADTTATSGAVSDAAPPAGTPLAAFPHWVHRIRYQCKTCHMGLFEPVVGANAVTMADFAQGRLCGACHDGVEAFAPTPDNCARCHVPTAPPGSGF